MTDRGIYNQRLKNLLDATSFREPDKVPIGMEFLSWPFAYAGVRYDEIIDDPQKTADYYVKFLDDIELDYTWAGGISQPYRAFEALGSKNYLLSNDGITVQHAQSEHQYMSVSDYDEMIKDPDTFRNEILPKKRVPAFQKSRQEAYEMLKKAAAYTVPFIQANKLIEEEIFEKRQVVKIITGDSLRFPSPFDNLFDMFRGIKNSLIDIRKIPNKVKEACDAIYECDMAKMKLNPQDYINKPFPFGMSVYHAAPYLSLAQYDEFFWHYFIKSFKPYAEAGVKIFLKGEGRFISKVHKYRELPKGTMVMMLEEDDPFEMHKEIGDWATLATGIQTSLLKYGKKQECIDYVKKCFDTFAPGGGFIFMPERPLLGANDVNIENAVAVWEFANEYAKQ